jgi:diamine N-acetyltransferase
MPEQPPVQHEQEMVTPNAISIAQAHFPARAWFRAIYTDEEPVGLVMLSDEPGKSTYYLWPS